MTGFERLACAAAGVCYGFVALHFVLTAGASAPYVGPLYRTVLALGAAFGLAVVRPLTAKVAGSPRGFLAWASTLAHVCLAVTIVEGTAGPQLGALRDLPLDTPFNLDPYTWLITGGMGLWLLAANTGALTASAWAKGAAYAGCAAGAACVAFPFAVLGAAEGLVPFVVELPPAAAIGILVPVWFLWMAAAGPRAEG